eukprot:12911718-Prorocentrum_lima.AAC.1
MVQYCVECNPMTGFVWPILQGLHGDLYTPDSGVSKLLLHCYVTKWSAAVYCVALEAKPSLAP